MNLEKRYKRITKKLEKLRGKEDAIVFYIDQYENLQRDTYQEIHKNDPPREKSEMEKAIALIYNPILEQQLREPILLELGDTKLVTNKFVSFKVPPNE